MKIFTDHDIEEIIFAILSDGEAHEETEIVEIVRKMEEVIIAERAVALTLEGKVRPSLEDDDLVWAARD